MAKTTSPKSTSIAQKDTKPLNLAQITMHQNTNCFIKSSNATKKFQNTISNSAFMAMEADNPSIIMNKSV